MALKSRKTIEKEWYTLEDQVDEDSPARFELRPLRTSEQMDVYDTFVGGKPTNKTFQVCFRLGCVSIENVIGANDKPIKTAHHFLMQPDFVDEAIEVGAAVFDKSFLSEDERKNL